MALERRNPLPVGRYWIDVAAGKALELDGFFKSHAARVHVENTEESGEVTFYIFSVSEPVPWFAVNFGFPTVAGPNIHSKADAVQSPDLPPSTAETAEGLLKKAGSLLELAAWGVGILIGIKILEAAKRK